jgi:hypothetical protein
MLYAWTADQINRAYLPGINLPEPSGGLFGYYAGALFAGALIGLACTWPENSWVGAVCGGVVGAILVFLAPWQQMFSSSTQTFGVFFLTLTTFLPLALILTPFAFLIRWSVDHFSMSNGGGFSLRQYGVPILATILAAWLGYSNLYSDDVRNAIYITQGLIEKGFQAKSTSQLSEPLKPIQGFIPNANGRYTLEKSDAVERFMGPRPVTSRSNSDFLVIARFSNGFKLACVFAPGVKQPNCANFN